MSQKAIVNNFLKTQLHMVISTTNKNGTPEGALVGFAQVDDLSLVFGTDSTTRKYQNIQNNPHVALTFGSNEEITVQYEGMAAVLDGQELTKYKEVYFAKNPASRKYENQENQIYLKITPIWIRYTDYNKEPAEIFEVNL